MPYDRPMPESFGGAAQGSQVTMAVAKQVVDLLVKGSTQLAADTINPNDAINGVLTGLAMVIEQAPQCETPRSLRKGSDHYAMRLGKLVQFMREQFNATGVHPIDHMLDRFAVHEGAGAPVN